MPDLSSRLSAAAAARADAALALLRAMIAAQRQGEAAVQAIVARALAEAGAEVSTLRYRPAEVPLAEEFAAEPPPGERESVLGVLPGSGGGRSLILFAHPDSEPLPAEHGWSVDPFAGVVRNGRLHGWGVADDLSGVAAMVSALDVLRAAGLAPRGRVVAASTPSKRHARGVHAVLHHGVLADAALYLHPAESGAGLREVKGFASGQIEFRITVPGRAPDTTEPGHGAFAHLGVNAIGKAMVVISALAALDERRAARVKHPALEAAIGRSTNLLVGGISGGAERGTRVPTECTLSCALAFPPGESLSAVRAEIEAAVAEAAASDPWLSAHPPRIVFTAGVTGAEVPPDHPLWAAAAAAIRGQTGAEPVLNPLHTGSDIRNPAVQKGIPCLGLGPLGGDLTQNGRTDEWVDAADHLRAVAATAGLIAEWCGAEEGARG
ncbi:MAG: M20/M25/M40 family metallo-hydrolase [Acetobacteraceae bacterium]|nr:M20/M25/M40 family metallo-hydrolase [Acetobacteraceae bacterium]